VTVLVILLEDGEEGTMSKYMDHVLQPIVYLSFIQVQRGRGMAHYFDVLRITEMSQAKNRGSVSEKIRYNTAMFHAHIHRVIA